jgi:hypothetical protein
MQPPKEQVAASVQVPQPVMQAWQMFMLFLK